jgi:hypothetical protein
MADYAADQGAGTVETKAEIKSPLKFTEHWLQALDIAGEQEKTWRDQAQQTLDRYRKTEDKAFNILFANTQTTVPALYNSEPVPDIRRRFGDDDAVGKTASDMLERLLIIQNELYDFDTTMKAAVKDRQLQGRGVSRVRVRVGASGSKSVCDEPVIWNRFRIGPSRTWADLPWLAFWHEMTREELIELSPKHGAEVNLDAMVEGAGLKDEAATLPDMFKRANVWEVWDRTERKVYWFAQSFKDGPLKVMDDPYKLRDFFCVPRPLYAIESTDTLKPVCEFMIWKPLADEMDGLTRRISGIVSVMKLRGLYAGQFEGLMTRLSGLNDGQMAAAEDAARAMQQGGLKDAIWMWPVDMAIKVVEGLYVAREQAKAALYEMTGVADIQRGQTDPNETLGAQQLKAQWGSLRLQAAQVDVQRYARDLLRMKADLSCQEMEFAEMVAMTGIKFVKPPEEPQPPAMGHNGGPAMEDPAAAQQAQMQAQMAQQQAMQQAEAEGAAMAQAVEQLLKGPDLQREFIVEIETDSTIRADLSRAQQNVSGFVTGLGEFMQGVGPAVQAGFMPPEIAVKYIGVFSRNFKLGREAETLTDEWVKALEKKAKEPPPPDPEQQKMQAEMQMKQQEAGMKAQAMQADQQAKAADRQQELQAQQQKNAMDMQMKQAELAMKEKELALKEREMGLKAQAAEQQMALDAQGAQQEHQFKMQSMHEQSQFDSRERSANAEHEDERRGADLEFQKQKQAMKPANGAAT